MFYKLKSFFSPYPSVRRFLNLSKKIDLKSIVDKDSFAIIANDFEVRKHEVVNETATHLSSGYMKDV